MRMPKWLRLLWLGAAVLVAACGRDADRPGVEQSFGAANSPCTIALAADTHNDPEVARLQQQARTSTSTIPGRDAAHALELLGFHYVTRARSSNDPGDYTLAEQVAACLEEREPGHAKGLLIRGHVLHQRHRFKEAETVARRLVAEREFVLDYGLLGDVLMEQGEIAQAGEAYQRMIDLKPFYQSYIRAAHLRWLKGDRRGAMKLVKEAINAASQRDREAIAWAYARLAHYELQAGQLREAARAIEAALATQADYAAALLARSRLHTAEGRRDEAVDDLRRAARVNPLPEYQWALADALRAANRDAEATTVESELERTGAQEDPRTFSLYLATRRRDTARALQLAERELKDRSDVFTLDAYAWALLAAGRVEEANTVMTRALSAGTDDARLFMHAASIASASGRSADARKWSERARRTRYTLFPSELEVLRAQDDPSAAQEN